ncbi:gamma-tubulin complex component 5-like [Amphiura filiformis]|uniref:gamma-tubulin complex component 5-like n=1 Tax=Amphiura filiformis TaxID=82378 RepID=UPI003B227CA9
MADVSKTEGVAEELVEKLTDFKNGSENFKRTMQYVLSNIKYHRYLDVNSHTVNKEIKGVLEKLQVHSKADKAEALQVVVDTFLEGPLVSPKASHPKSDAHYSVLSVLLLLAGTPTSQDYEEKTEHERQNEEPDFDWPKYLLEDLPPIKDFNEPSSDEWEDEEEVSIPEEPLNDSGVITDQSRHPTDNTSQSQLAILSHVTGSTVTGGGDADRSWLSRNVVVQYWQGEVDMTMEGTHKYSQIARQWETHEKEQSIFPIVNCMHDLTETHIIRETLWILMGAEESFVFQRHGNHFEVRENIRVNHLTPSSLNTMLQSLANDGSCILQLQSFVNDMRSCPSAYCNRGDSALSSQESSRCQTYEAYAEALAEFLHSFRNALVQIEKTVLVQEQQMTLANVMDQLSPWMPKVKLLAYVHNKAVVDCPQQKHVYRVWYLLDMLHNSIMEHYSMGDSSKEIVNLLVRIWLQSIRPYVDFIDRWLTLGHLFDPAHEFVIQRNSAVEVKSPHFWQEGFTLDRFQTEESTHRGQIAVPPFLQPVLRHIILAGKCMEVLGSVGQLGTIRTEANLESTSMYSNLITSTKDMDDICSSSSIAMATEEEQDESATRTLVVQQLQLPGTTDPLLAKNFDEVLGTLLDSDEKAEERYSQSDASILPDVNNMPLLLVIKRSLYPSILSRCNVICQQLVNTLKTKFDLMANLAILRKFYLLEDGDVMCDFYVDIFEKLRRQESWSDYLYLHGHLQEALGRRYPEEIERVTVSVSSDEISARLAARPIHALDGLTLHYQVDHPLNIIINSQSLDVYNRVFRFLLQVKRAKHSLDQVLADLKKETHEDEEGKPVTNSAPVVGTRMDDAIIKHQLYLLRFKLMHFVNSIHNYLMTRILHTTSLEFQDDFNRATDLDGVLSAHENYLTKVLQRCLLHDKVSLVREAVVKVLNIALVFQRKWDAGIHTFSDDSINKMESEFNNCSIFLSTMLINMTKRGAFPHLAALSFSLASLQQSTTSSPSK